MATSMKNHSKTISVTTIVIAFIASVTIIYTLFWPQTLQPYFSTPSSTSPKQLPSPIATEHHRPLAPKQFFSSNPETSVLQHGPNTVHHGSPTANADNNRGYPGDASNPTANSTWEESLPTRKGGFLMVQPEDGPAVQYGVSMFHQLHCVMMIREKLAGGGHKMHHHARDGDVKGRAEDRPSTEEEHLGHCLDYIAQAILCAADDTIEPAQTWVNAEGKKVRILNGIGQIHQCRDPAAVWQAVVKSESGPVKAWDFKNGDSLSSLQLIP